MSYLVKPYRRSFIRKFEMETLLHVQPNANNAQFVFVSIGLATNVLLSKIDIIQSPACPFLWTIS